MSPRRVDYIVLGGDSKLIAIGVLLRICVANSHVLRYTSYVNTSKSNATKIVKVEEEKV